MIHIKKEDCGRFNARHHTDSMNTELAFATRRILLEGRATIDKLLNYDFTNISFVQPAILRELGMNLTPLADIANLLKVVTEFNTRLENRDTDDELHTSSRDVYEYEENSLMLDIGQVRAYNGTTVLRPLVIILPR
jgi:hypothetical protein